MKVRVTAEDIAKGKKWHVGKCPIARAIRRRTKRRVKVSALNIEVGKKLYRTPDEAYWFMARFDMGKKVKAFTLDLRKEG